ncbi:MAG: hypothetical protein V3W41_22575 [Planctomycetota bacterium]
MKRDHLAKVLMVFFTTGTNEMNCYNIDHDGNEVGFEGEIDCEALADTIIKSVTTEARKDGGS